MNDYFYWADFFGTIVFAISGALAARSHKLDYFGGVVLATATAVGGGTLRDMILGRTPVFWVTNPELIIGIVLASFCTYLFFGKRNFPERLLLFPDAFGLAVFAVVGTIIANNSGASWAAAPVLGSMTAVCGGMIRDVLSGKVPIILYRDFYATAAVLGAALTELLSFLGVPDFNNACIAVPFTLVLRLLAIRYNWSLPFYSEMSDVEESHE